MSALEEHSEPTGFYKAGSPPRFGKLQSTSKVYETGTCTSSRKVTRRGDRCRPWPSFWRHPGYGKAHVCTPRPWVSVQKKEGPSSGVGSGQPLVRRSLRAPRAARPRGGLGPGRCCGRRAATVRGRSRGRTARWRPGHGEAPRVETSGTGLGARGRLVSPDRKAQASQGRPEPVVQAGWPLERARAPARALHAGSLHLRVPGSGSSGPEVLCVKRGASGSGAPAHSRWEQNSGPKAAGRRTHSPAEGTCE